MKLKRGSNQRHASWYFLIVVIVIYFVVACVNYTLFSSSLIFFSKLITKIVPIFILIFILMAVTNLFVTPQFVTKHFKDTGIKKWIFVIIGGILSTGPIYMWYPLLADLRKKGVNNGFIAAFLYSRAIKIPLLPVIIFYFNLKYVIVLSIVMIGFSIIQGIAVNRILPQEQ